MNGIGTSFWRPAGVAWMAFCLAGLAAGLWGEVVYPFSEYFPALSDLQTAPLPVLRTLAVAQAWFFLLGWPVILLHRSRKGSVAGGVFCPGRLLLETGVWMLASVPFYVVAVWLSDATAQDAVRTILAVLAVYPLGFLAGVLLRRPAWRSAVLMLLALLLWALPAGWYISTEFLGRFGREWLAGLSPTLFIWQVAHSRLETLWPTPLWAWIVWPVVAAVGDLLLWVTKPSGVRGTTEDIQTTHKG